MKTNETERNETYSNQIENEELADGLSRMTLKIKKKKQDRETATKTGSSKRKIAILRSYNMELENGKEV